MCLSHYFKIKKRKTLNKLRSNKDENTIVIIVYNSDAAKKGYKPQLGKNEFSCICGFSN